MIVPTLEYPVKTLLNSPLPSAEVVILNQYSPINARNRISVTPNINIWFLFEFSIDVVYDGYYSLTKKSASVALELILKSLPEMV